MKKNKNITRTRTVSDSMGKVKVPKNALYGAQTQRAINNFPISDLQFTNDFIYSVVIIKRSAAIINYNLKSLNKKQKDSIVKACDEILKGNYDNQFPVDVYQTGSGTSTNMNCNEVIATIANTFTKSKSNFIHPNDHVNLGQSSNDVIPTAIHISSLKMVEEKLLPALQSLEKSLLDKSSKFKDIIKIGRTHLQDATPMTVGQEFSGYKEIISKNIKRININKSFLCSLAQGGTAIGTGINTHKNFGEKIAEEISRITQIEFIETKNHFESQSSQDSIVGFSGDLKTLAVGLSKIANDIRWLASGPRSGLGELIIPSIQPGSSIMPGKVNPVMCESLIQVCAQVIANDSAITLGGLGSIFELNLMLPLIANNILCSIKTLSNAVNAFNTNLIEGLEVNIEKCKNYIEGSLAMCTSLAPIIGYDKAAEIAYEAYKKNKSIREVAKEKKIMTDSKLDKLLDPQTMIKPK